MGLGTLTSHIFVVVYVAAHLQESNKMMDDDLELEQELQRDTEIIVDGPVTSRDDAIDGARGRDVSD